MRIAELRRSIYRQPRLAGGQSHPRHVTCRLTDPSPLGTRPRHKPKRLTTTGFAFELNELTHAQ